MDPTNALITLALLGEGQKSGYDLKRTIDERLEGLVDMTSGTIYYTLKRLEARGLVRSTRSRQSRGPERRIYRLTSNGKRGLGELLRQVMVQPIRLFSPFDMALYFTPLISSDTLVRAMDQHLEELHSGLERLHHLEEKHPGRWPFHFYYLKEKAIEDIQLQERWYQRMKRKVEEKSRREARETEPVLHSRA